MSVPQPIFAHLGHWYISLPVFMGPALALIVFLKWQTWREGRSELGSEDGRSSVEVSHAERRTVVAVRGPLDYPALLEIEVELGRAEELLEEELLLDLSGLTEVQEESAWHLCDVLGRVHAREHHLSAIVGRDPGMRSLADAFSAEGVPMTLAGAQTASS